MSARWKSTDCAYFVQVLFVAGQQVVDDRDFRRALAQQGAHDRRADEPGASGDNVFVHDGRFGDFRFEMAQGFVGELLRARREVECFERNPAFVIEPAQRVQHRLEIVSAPPAVPAVEFVDVHMADEVEVPLDQRGVRIGLVDGVVHVEHGPDRRAVDLAHERGGLGERQHHIALGLRAGLRSAP